jgi:PAS domain S-box-containing protein
LRNPDGTGNTLRMSNGGARATIRGKPPLSPPAGYGLALLFAALAIAIRVALDGYLSGVQFITYFPAVIAAAYLGGVVPGLFCGLVCGLASWYLLIPPFYSFRIIDPAHGYTIALYVAVVTAIALLVGRLREIRFTLAETERRLNAVLDNASVAVFLLGERHECIYMNAAAEELTGFTFEETQGHLLHELIHHKRPDGSHFPIDDCPIGQSLAREERQQGEDWFVRKDGSFYPVAYTASPIRGARLKMVGTVLEVRDISVEKRAEEHQRLLMNELNHRVKNTLAIVQSVAMQTFGAKGVDGAALQAFDGRLAALSGAHNLLTEQSWQSASLREVVAQTLGRGCGADPGRFEADGPDLALAPRTAVSIAMALHELCTNAMKYGALSSPEGRVSVRWRFGERDGEKRLLLEWEESGGPAVSAPSRRGFGTRMIERGLAAELAGTARIEFAPRGVICRVDAPLPESG